MSAPEAGGDAGGGAAAGGATLGGARSGRLSPERSRLGGTLRGGGTMTLSSLTPEDVSGAWDSVAALGLPPHVRALLEDAKVAQARPAPTRRPTLTPACADPGTHPPL